MASLSDFGQPVRVAPVDVQDWTLHFGGDMPPHWHASELRRMHAQVVECECGFWLPVGACCPACGRHSATCDRA